MSKFIGSSYFLEILGYSELTTSFCPCVPYKYSLFSVCHGVEKGGKRWHRMNQEPGMAARRSPNRMLYQLTGSWTQTGVVWLREELHLRHCAGNIGRTLWSNGHGRWGMRSGRMSTELLEIRGVGKNTWSGAGMANVFWKGPESTHEGFVDPIISVVTTQLCHCCTKAALDNTHKGHGNDPMNLFYKNGWGANLPTPDAELIRPPVSTLHLSTSATPGQQWWWKARRIQWATVQSTENSVSHIKAFVRC